MRPARDIVRYAIVIHIEQIIHTKVLDQYIGILHFHIAVGGRTRYCIVIRPNKGQLASICIDGRTELRLNVVPV